MLAVCYMAQGVGKCECGLTFEEMGRASVHVSAQGVCVCVCVMHDAAGAAGWLLPYLACALLWFPPIRAILCASVSCPCSKVLGACAGFPSDEILALVAPCACAAACL